jgi:Lrp/AsnC family transcriptional regulator, leucine-responsive regulatory protein
MDETDKKIAALLQDDCFMPQAEIARAVDRVTSSVNERMRKLKAEGYVRAYRAELDPARAGFPILAFVNVLLDDAKNAAAFPKSAIKVPEVLECHHVTGEWNFLLKVRARSTADFESILTGKIKKQRGVVRTNTSIVLVSHKETHALPI